MRSATQLPPGGPPPMEELRQMAPRPFAAPRAPAAVRWISLAVFYAAIALFIYPDWINIGLQHGIEEAEEVRFFGMPTPDIAVVLILGFIIATDDQFRRAFFGKAGLVFFGILAGYSFLGVLLGNEVGWVREDLRVWSWAVAGLAAFHLIMKSTRPCAHILALCLISAGVLFLSARGAQATVSNDAYLSNERIWDLNVFNYSDAVIVLLGLVFPLCALRNAFYSAGALAAVTLFFYSTVMISATRSLSLALLLVCALAVPSLLFQRNRDVITLRMGGSAAWVGAAVACIGMLVAATFFGLAFTGSTVLADRWQAGDIDSGVDRFVELGDALKQLGSFKAVTGGGLGYTFESIFDYTALGLHIGLFTFLLKFGILPFLAVAFSLYIYLPYKYAQALLRPLSLDPRMRTALLVTIPGILGWALILSMSGGYDRYFFLGIGLSLGVFNEIRARGLREICR
jgi:hypothetical protein